MQGHTCLRKRGVPPAATLRSTTSKSSLSRGGADRLELWSEPDNRGYIKTPLAPTQSEYCHRLADIGRNYCVPIRNKGLIRRCIYRLIDADFGFIIRMVNCLGDLIAVDLRSRGRLRK